MLRRLTKDSSLAVSFPFNLFNFKTFYCARSKNIYRIHWIHVTRIQYTYRLCSSERDEMNGRCVSSDCASFIVRYLVHLLCCLTDEWRDDRELRRSSQYRTEWQQWTSVIHFQQRLLYIFSTFSIFPWFFVVVVYALCNATDTRFAYSCNNIENVINNNRAMGTN